MHTQKINAMKMLAEQLQRKVADEPRALERIDFTVRLSETRIELETLEQERKAAGNH